jgi:O-antigen biosynthesis protein
MTKKAGGRIIRILNESPIVPISEVVPGFVGFIDGVEGGFLQGWVRHTEEGADPVQFDLYINDEPVARSVIASKSRSDLVELGLGDVAFDIPLPVRFSGIPIQISLRLPEEDDIILSVNLETTTPWADLPNRYLYRIEKADYSGFHGWVVDKFDPGSLLEIDVLINGQVFARADNSFIRADLAKRSISPNGIGGFAVHFAPNLFDSTGDIINFRLSDGTTSTPQRIEQSIQATSSNFNSISPESVDVAIIVPIFNAFEDLLICVERVLLYTDRRHKIILIDDASTDPQVKAFLDTLRDEKNVEILYNPTNQGFTRTVNLGIGAAGRLDVVLLNSDARVTPRWLEGLLRAAASDKNICSVTPLSNRAGAFSAPAIGNENMLPTGVDEPEYAIAVRRKGRGFYPSVPTGNGFCMYVRRAAIDDVGMFDVEAFPRGYGEENDFCMKAERAGWRHVIDDRTYVFHERSKSFKSEKTELMSAGRAVVDQRYPEYKQRIQVFSKGTTIVQARFNASQAVADLDGPSRALPRVLFVISTMTGGTPQTNRDLMYAVMQGWEPWLLHCDSKTISLYKVEKPQDKLIHRHHLTEAIEPVTFRSPEYNSVVSGWLHYYDFDVVHIRHLAWHSIDLPRLSRNAGAAAVMSFHDYHVLCPTVKLKDENNVFCAGTCTATEGDCKAALWPDSSFPRLKDSWVHEWRRKYAQAMAYCDLFITTSEHARNIISTKLPLATDRFAVIPHGRDFQAFGSTFKVPEPDGILKILVPGHIDESKGSGVISALLELDVANRLQFHILGTQGFFVDDPRVKFHGGYKREEFASVALRIGAHVGAVLSTWDETWCHTLTELWSIGLPAIVLDYPTVASRVYESGAGWVFSKDDFDALHSGIVRLQSDYQGFFEKLFNVQKWQRGLGKASTTKLMGARYELAYKSALQAREARRGTSAARSIAATLSSNGQFTATQIVAVVCPADSDLISANASTHIRVWERTLNRVDRKYQFCRMTADQLSAAVLSGQITQAILQRDVLQDSHWTQIKPFVVSGALKVVVDIDDDLLNVPLDKDHRGSYLAGKDRMEDILRSAGAIFASTTALRKKLAALNPNIHVIENGLSQRIWRGRFPAGKPSLSRRALYMGSRSHLDDLRMIMPALVNVAEQNPNFRLRTIGILSGHQDDFPWIEYVPIPDKARNYPEFVQFLKTQAADCDFGIAPLVNNDFNRCKSPLKVFEYAGLGLPVLASRGTVYNKVCSEAPLAIAVENTSSAWYQNFDAMLGRSKADLRADGARMRDWVFSSKTLDASLDSFDRNLAVVFGAGN